MHKKNFLIQFASLTSLWNFRNHLELNIYAINTLDMTISFDWDKTDDLQPVIEKYNGRVCNSLQNVSLTTNN